MYFIFFVYIIKKFMSILIIYLLLANISASNVKVIPASIQSDDLRIEGIWSRFNLTWPEETEVTYGAVFYKVFVEAVNNSRYLVSNWTC